MKLNIIAISAMALVVAALSAIGVCNYLNDSDDKPDLGLYMGKINTSELYQMDKFSWYTYKETENYAVTGEPSYNKHITFDYRDAIYNGSLTKHYRKSITYFNSSGTNLTEFVDNYWDKSGATYLSTHSEVLADGIVIHSVDMNYSGMGPYSKRLFAIPYGYDIVPTGWETVTIGDTTYDCTKYYLPDHRQGNTIEILQNTLWINDSIPVPVKIHFNINVTYELAAWG